MVKHIKKSRGKRKVKSVSFLKLSNKRLNKLAKQGKLKKKLNKNQLKHLLELRTKKKSSLRSEEETTYNEVDNTVIDRQTEEEIPLEENDFDYFGENDRDLSFLSMVSEELGETRSRKTKRKLPDKDDEIEKKYEDSSQKRPKEKLLRALLPIKTQDKLIERSEEFDHPENEEDIEVNDQKDGDQNVAQKLSPEELVWQQQRKYEETKQSIAVLSAVIIENPQEHMKQLKELRLILEDCELPFFALKKLALLSLLEVFKDILPGYRIRLVTDAERQQSVKKDTKQLREFEESLLRNYRHFLEFLEIAIRGHSSLQSKKQRKEYAEKKKNIVFSSNAQVLRQLSLRCLCELLVAHPHFNYRNNIVAIIVPCMGSDNTQISDMVCDYVRQVFKSDKVGELPLEIVRLIGKMIKAKNFDIHPKVLKTFLSLKLKDANFEQQSDTQKPAKMYRKEKFAKTSRRDRKKQKHMVELERELQETESTEDKKKRSKLHTETIQMVFVSYFRILKNAPSSVLLSAVLEGLAKYAHLINVEFFDDLFSVIKGLIEQEGIFHRDSLHCLQTVFTILLGQGSALNVDPLSFYKHLYKSLLHVHAGKTHADLLVIIQCLHLMFNKRKKQVSYKRLLGFIKRMSTVSLQLLPNGCLAMLASARSCLHMDAKSDIMFENEFQGSGTYLAELPEPEHCNAHNTVLWEFHLLRRHFHPTVRRYASHMCFGAPSQGSKQLHADLARREPTQLYADYDPNGMKFQPSVADKPRIRAQLSSREGFLQNDFEDLCAQTLDTTNIVKHRKDTHKR